MNKTIGLHKFTTVYYFFRLEFESSGLIGSQKEEDKRPELDHEQLRAENVRLLEQLQNILDENNLIRFKYRALITQIPQIPSFSVNDDDENVNKANLMGLSPEDIEEMRKELVDTLSKYREETRKAAKTSESIENITSEFESFRLQVEREQGEALNALRESADAGMKSYQEKIKRIQSTWDTERERLRRSIKTLQRVRYTAASDIFEYEQQSKNNKAGIANLTTSITIANEDIQLYKNQIKYSAPQLKEYHRLKEVHQQKEKLMVEISDQLDSVRLLLETDSLTSQIRKEIDNLQSRQDKLNEEIDQLHCRLIEQTERSKAAYDVLPELNQELAKLKKENETLYSKMKSMKEERDRLKSDLQTNATLEIETGGDNEILKRKLQTLSLTPTTSKPWNIRKEVVKLKRDAQKQAEIQNSQLNIVEQIENQSKVPPHQQKRKRVPLIPLSPRH